MYRRARPRVAPLRLDADGTTASGIDVEPNNKDIVKDLTFTRIKCNDCSGNGARIGSSQVNSRSENIQILGACEFLRNGLSGLKFDTGNTADGSDVVIADGQGDWIRVENNGIFGLVVGGPAGIENATIRKVWSRNNGAQGILARAGCTDLTIRECDSRGNFNADIRVQHCIDVSLIDNTVGGAEIQKIDNTNVSESGTVTGAPT